MAVAKRKPLEAVFPMLLGLVLLVCASCEENKPAREASRSDIGGDRGWRTDGQPVRTIPPSIRIPQSATLPVDSATMMVEGKLVAQPPSAVVVKDAFGPGQNGLAMYGNMD